MRSRAPSSDHNHVVICVDDERIVLDSIGEQLRRGLASKCLVELAESGEEALEVLEDVLENGDKLACLGTFTPSTRMG